MMKRILVTIAAIGALTLLAAIAGLAVFTDQETIGANAFDTGTFTNGNGRHARLFTDIFLHSRQHPIPQWPQIQLMVKGNEVREQYITAMKKADDGDLTNLIHFIEECLEPTS